MNDGPIKTLAPADLDYAVVSYDFSGLTADELSSLPQTESVIDSLLSEFAISIGDQTTLIAGMAGDLDDLNTILSEMTGDDFSQVLGELSNAGIAGDSLLADYVSTLDGTGTSSTGGGSGGGGGAPQCALVNFGAIPVTGPLGSVTVKQTMDLQNTGSDALKIISHSFSADLGFTFVLDPNVDGAVLQPGGILAITVDFTPGSVGSYQSTLTLKTNRPDPQPCLNLTGSGIPGSPVGGGPIRCPIGNVVVAGKHTITPQCA